MRALAPLTIAALFTASVPRAQAGKCDVDSDCPIGTVCSFDGGCVAPAGSGDNSSSSGVHRSTAVVLLYGVILIALVAVILVPAMRATDEADGARRAAFDQAFAPPTCPSDQRSAVTGFAIAF